MCINSYESVSVIIPVFNAENYIALALESVIKQQYPNLEIIIVDDCSSDNTSIIVNQYQQLYSYIKYYRLDRNSGVSAARNEAIKHADGRYIAFLDSDDIWLEGKLNTQIMLHEKYEGVPFTYTAIAYIDDIGNCIKGKRSVPEVLSYNKLLTNTIVATSSVIIDRKVVGNFSFPNRKSAEDYSLWLTLLKQYGNARGLNEVYTEYRKTATSLSANRVKEVKFFYEVQTEDININKFKALLNTLRYIINAVKKHYF